MHKKTGFNAFFNSFLLIAPINALMLLLMTLFRFVFFIYFADFNEISSLKFYVLKAFWMGFRFDVSVLAYINIPVTLVFLMYLFFKKDFVFKLGSLFVKYYYLTIFPFLSFMFFADFGLFSYYKDRCNYLLFEIFKDDIIALFKTMLSDNRIYIVFILFLIIWFFIYKVVSFTYCQLKSDLYSMDLSRWKNSKKIVITVLIIATHILSARGTLSKFPLSLFYSQISPDYFINLVCINPIYSLVDLKYHKVTNSKDVMDLKDFFEYKSDTEILSDLKVFSVNSEINSIQSDFIKKTINKNDLLKNINPNVILIVIEGFGEMPVLNNSSTFDVMGELKQHFEQDTVFYNFLPAGFLTVHGVESIILNIPPRPFATHIIQTPYALKYFSTSGAIPYNRSGYDTIFFYGGKLEWRNLGQFFKTQGFNKTIGEENMQVTAKEKHLWGIKDDSFFKNLKQYLIDNRNGKPKFIFALSTGLHDPYKMSRKYVPLPLEIPVTIEKAMSVKDLKKKGIFTLYQFACRELAKFISYVKNSEFADNTIIAVTGDHSLRELVNYSKEDQFLCRSVLSLYT